MVPWGLALLPSPGLPGTVRGAAGARTCAEWGKSRREGWGGGREKKKRPANARWTQRE